MPILLKIISHESVKMEPIAEEFPAWVAIWEANARRRLWRHANREFLAEVIDAWALIAHHQIEAMTTIILRIPRGSHFDVPHEE